MLWTIPTFGLLVTSFRPVADINNSGWWTVLTNPNFTLENYQTVLSTESSQSLAPSIVNSIVITIPRSCCRCSWRRSRPTRSRG